MNKNEDINELLARYFAHEPLTLVQQRALDEWISANGQEFERMRKLMETPVRVSKEIHFDAEKAWQKIEPRLQERPKTVAFRRKMTFIWSAAASLLLLLGIGTFYLLRTGTEEQFIRYANTGTKVQRVLLPDSSEVILYPNATLAYSFSGKEEGRHTQLRGKAFFQVKKMHGIPFQVKTALLNVEVLGTSFLVDVTQQEKAGVYVKTGKVRVEASSQKVVIEANEKAELKNGTLQADTISRPQDVFGEKQQVLVFEQTPVTEVVKVIAEKTGVRIDLEKGLEKNLITTRISLSETNIASELAFLCGCKCETLVEGKHYRLYEK